MAQVKLSDGMEEETPTHCDINDTVNFTLKFYRVAGIKKKKLKIFNIV